MHLPPIPTADRLDSYAFAVDLGAFELALGSEVVVVIETKSDCGVKVINPQVLEVRSTCAYAFSGLDLEGQSLSWKTNGESGALPFVVQQYRWGRWSVVGEVAGNDRAIGRPLNDGVRPSVRPANEQPRSVRDEGRTGGHVVR